MCLFIEDRLGRLQQRKEEGRVMFLGALGEVPFCTEITYASLYSAFGRIERKTYFLYEIRIF